MTPLEQILAALEHAASPDRDVLVSLIWRLTEPHDRDASELDPEGDIYGWGCAWCGEPVTTLDEDDQEQGHGAGCAYAEARAIVHRFGKVREP